MARPCRDCGQWIGFYRRGDGVTVPMNVDGGRHDCSGRRVVASAVAIHTTAAPLRRVAKQRAESIGMPAVIPDRSILILMLLIALVYLITDSASWLWSKLM